MAKAKNSNKKTVNRSSVTGKFVNEKYTKEHPDTTETEHVNKGKRKNPKKPPKSKK